ncbi:MAG: non-heme iron oxygenase ferredoxin subunit [Armatimonadetes bacterium]|nr:non-heme iron oxygenase ferredoxin subunit [Armatimonadota bacterium]
MRAEIGRIEDFPEGEVRVVRVDGDRVGVCKAEGRLYAFEDRCTHDDGPLGQGRLIGCEVECPRHGARFDVRDGSVRRAPAVYPIEVYPVTVHDDGRVEVELED